MVSIVLIYTYMHAHRQQISGLYADMWMNTYALASQLEQRRTHAHLHTGRARKDRRTDTFKVEPETDRQQHTHTSREMVTNRHTDQHVQGQSAFIVLAVLTMHACRYPRTTSHSKNKNAQSYVHRRETDTCTLTPRAQAPDNTSILTPKSGLIIKRWRHQSVQNTIGVKKWLLSNS